MSEEWKTFQEEEPKKGQYILVCHTHVFNTDDLEAYPYPFKFEDVSGDYFLVSEGIRGKTHIFKTFGTVWRDMIKLPGEE